jgi:hypothetical protein
MHLDAQRGRLHEKGTSELTLSQPADKALIRILTNVSYRCCIGFLREGIAAIAALRPAMRPKTAPLMSPVAPGSLK